jgi:hypothetical protein
MTADLPVVSELDAGDDRIWFRDNPTRRYRLRQAEGGWWLIRRRGRSAMLRVFSETMGRVPDNDEALRGYWFSSAYPTLSQDELLELIADARKLETVKKPPGNTTARSKASSRPASTRHRARGRRHAIRPHHKKRPGLRDPAEQFPFQQPQPKGHPTT